MRTEPLQCVVLKMKFSLFLIVSFFALSFCFSAHGQDDARVTATWQMQKYDIAATLPANDSDRNLTSKAKLEIKNVSSRPATTLTLRISPSAEVSAVTVNGGDERF